MVSANASGHRPLVRHQGAICNQWSLVLIVMGPARLLKTSALDGLLVLVTDCRRMAEPRLCQIQVHGMELNTCIWEDVSELSRNFPPSPAGLTTPSATRSRGSLKILRLGGCHNPPVKAVGCTPANVLVGDIRRGCSSASAPTA